MRMTDDEWREQCAKRARWQRGSEIVSTDGPDKAGTGVGNAPDISEMAHPSQRGIRPLQPQAVADPSTYQPGKADAVASGDTRAYSPAAPKSTDAASTGPIPERDILADCIKACKVHPRVAWVERINTGAYKTQAGHYVRYGFKGCSDIIGQLTDGKWLAIECKRAGKPPSTEQIEFLGRVTRAGGVGFVAWSAEDVRRGLGDLPEAA